MRAGKTEVIGTTGQSAVKAQFEQLRWGANPNDDHDLGTDLWLQPRDERRFDLNTVAGAQVKTSGSKGPGTYFKTPEMDPEGKVLGWWYYESDDDHFDYWTKHTAPHFLVLHDLETHDSYWVHVSKERLEAAGGGTRIMVPAHQLIDEAHNRELIEVATSGRPSIQWEGTAGGGGKEIAATDLLRHALIVPRLVAPHRNDRPKAFNAEQALAALLLLRKADLQDTVPETKAQAKTKLWAWTLFTAFKKYLETDEPESFRTAYDSAKKPSDKVAVTCAWAAALLERAEVTEALALLDEVISNDKASPPDHVWLLVQRARCLNELGSREEAKRAALEALSERTSAPDDPTMSALCGAAASVVYTSSPFGARNIADFIAGSDNIASWWRTQVTAWGLSANFEEQFQDWSRDSKRRVGFEDTAWNYLRASSLIAGLVGDQGSWTQSYAKLAKLQLMRTNVQTEAAEVAKSLVMLCRAGETDSLADATRRVVLEGPAAAARAASESVRLEVSTRTTLLSNMNLLRSAGDVLAPDVADSTAKWCMTFLSDLQSFHRLYLPNFHVPNELLKLLTAVVPALSAECRSSLVGWLVDLPGQSDQLTAQGYASVFRVVSTKPRDAGVVEKLAARQAEDHADLSLAIDKLRAEVHVEYRLSLLYDIEQGDHAALHKFGDVQALTGPAVLGMLAKLGEEVRETIALAKRGAYSLGSYDSPHTLVLLNLWHPDHAQWDPFFEFLEEPGVSKDDLVRSLALLGRTTLDITADKERLAKSLRRLMTETGGDAEWLFGEWADVRGLATEALFAVDPVAVSDMDLWALMRGSSEQQISAALIIARRERPEEFGMLVALTASDDTSVQAVVANCLAGWVSRGIARDESSAWLEAMLDNPGTELARAVVARAKGAPEDDGMMQIIDQYKNHLSASVRNMIGAIQRGPTLSENVLLSD